MEVKLDISKAYDRVEWNFIQEIMSRIGFAQKWIESIMKCISSVSYSTVVNGNKWDIFYPTTGLKQGDPLSPFLLLICGEGLSSLMWMATGEGVIKGVKASRSGPRVSHLLFADDCILFEEATRRGVCTIKQILREYKNSSGQCVNFEKSSVFKEVRQIVVTQLGIQSSNELERYLGLPSLVGRRKKIIFLSIEGQTKTTYW